MLKLKGGEKLLEPAIIPTPSFGLNYVLSGGIWSGRFTTLWGNPGAGKTSMALYILAEAQKQGFVPVIVDSEGSYTDSWAEKCGVDLSQRIYIRSTIVEEILDEIVPLMKEKDKKYFFLLDTLNTMLVENFYKNDSGTGGIGLSARSQTFMLQKLASYLGPNNGVILIVQQQVNLGGLIATIDAKIGNAGKHWSTNIIKLFASISKEAMVRDKDGTILDKRVAWTVQKSKQGPIEGVKGEYWFSPQSCTFDQTREIVEFAVTVGIIQKGGAWFNFGDRKFQGYDNLIAGMTEEDIVYLREILQKSSIKFDIETGEILE